MVKCEWGSVLGVVEFCGWSGGGVQDDGGV